VRNATERLYETLQEIKALRAEVARLHASVDGTWNELEALRLEVLSTLGANHEDERRLLELIFDDETQQRQNLWRVRETALYEEAYEDPEPLVTVGIPTYTNTKDLIERSIPSILAQTYERFEIVVVGDAAAPEVADAVAAVGDPRIRYANLTHRGPYPDDPSRLWHVAGGQATNEAMRIGRGRWYAQMDDDDAATPDRIELLLNAARERRLEFVYGRLRMHKPDGGIDILCDWPPRLHAVGLATSLHHMDLRFITSELGDADLDVIGDWARVRRMMRIGVRIGMIDDIVLDYFPRQLWERQDGG
jgi:glycosyltransferase involved in cell wall biosynthesis